jgi:hypothetical protein
MPNGEMNENFALQLRSNPVLDLPYRGPGNPYRCPGNLGCSSGRIHAFIAGLGLSLCGYVFHDIRFIGFNL